MPRALVPLLAITFVDVLGFTILIPILPFYAEHFGASPTTVGAIYSTVAVASLLSSPFWGRLSDRIGRKGVLIAAQVAGLLGFSLLASGTALWTVFVSRAIEGLGGGGLGVTQAYVTDVTTPANRARASLRSPLLGRLLLTQFTFWFSFTSWVTVFALFTERVLGYGPAQTSYLFIVSSVVTIVVQAGLIGRLVDRYGEGRIAIAGLSCAVAAYGTVFFVTTTPALYAWVVLWALSSALLRPALGAMIAEAAPAGQRGTILSVNDSLNGVAFLIAPLAATAVVRSNAHLVGIIPVAFVCIALTIGYRVFAAPRAAAETATAS